MSMARPSSQIEEIAHLYHVPLHIIGDLDHATFSNEDMNAIPDEEGGNLYLVNGSFTKLEDADAFAEKGGNADE